MIWSSASAHSLFCDLKFYSSASTHGIFFGLKFRLRIQNSVWLGAQKWRNSASAQGKYCGLEVTKFRFHTINLVRLEVSQIRFHTRALTFSPAVPPPNKEYSVTWSSAVSLPHKEYTMSRSSAVLHSHTEQSVTWSSAVSHNILWLEFPQFRFRKKRRNLKFRTSASAREHYFSFGKSTLIQPSHPFLNFRAVSHECWTLWRTEKQRNRDAPGKSRR